MPMIRMRSEEDKIVTLEVSEQQKWMIGYLGVAIQT